MPQSTPRAVRAGPLSRVYCRRCVKQGEVHRSGGTGEPESERGDIAALNGGNEDDAAAIGVEALNSDQAFSLVQPVVGFAGEGHRGSVVGNVVPVAASPHLDEHWLAGTVIQPGVDRRLTVFVQRGQRCSELRFSKDKAHPYSMTRSAASRRESTLQ